MKTRSIYVVGSSIGAVKIGIAANAKTRFYSIRVGCPIPVTLEFVGQCEHAFAREIERGAHRRLRQSKLCGEWFSISPADAVQAIFDVASELGHNVERLDATTPGRLELKYEKKMILAINNEILDGINAYRAECLPRMVSRSGAIREIIASELSQWKTALRRVKPRISSE